MTERHLKPERVQRREVPATNYERLMAASCKGAHKPHEVRISIPDSFVRGQYSLAGKALYGQDLAGFFQFCAAYVIQNHPELEAVRGKIRRAEERLARKRAAVSA